MHNIKFGFPIATFPSYLVSKLPDPKQSNRLQVEVLGLISDVVKRRESTTFSLRDQSGIVICDYFNDRISLPVELCSGMTLKVRGDYIFNNFYQAKVINVEQIGICRDPNEETCFYIDLMNKYLAKEAKRKEPEKNVCAKPTKKLLLLNHRPMSKKKGIQKLKNVSRKTEVQPSTDELSSMTRLSIEKTIVTYLYDRFQENSLSGIYIDHIISIPQFRVFHVKFGSDRFKQIIEESLDKFVAHNILNIRGSTHCYEINTEKFDNLEEKIANEMREYDKSQFNFQEIEIIAQLAFGQCQLLSENLVRRIIQGMRKIGFLLELDGKRVYALK